MSLPRYEKYKGGELEWLSAVPAHWSVEPLKRCFSIVGGSTPKSDQAAFWDGEIVWVTPADLSRLPSLYIGHSARKITQDGLDSCGTNLVPPGTIVLSTRAPIGSLAIATLPLCTNQGCKSMVPNGRSDSLYFAYVLLSATAALNLRGKGTTFLELSTDELSAFKAPTPPLSEQRAIATFLDRETIKIDALIAEQEKLITLLAEKRQATIAHAVTRGLNPDVPMKDSGVAWLRQVPAHWGVRKLSYDVDVLPGFAFPSAGFSLDESHVKLLRGVNVGVGSIRWDDAVYWNRTENDGLGAFELQPNDLVLGMDRPWISGGLRIARISEDDLPCLLLQRVAVIRSRGFLQTAYLYPLLQAGYFFHHCAPEMTGVSVPHISPDQIRSFVVPLPPVNEQVQISAHIQAENLKLDALTNEAKRSIELLRERRNALITAAVTGQIDVRNTIAEQYTARETATA